VLREVDKNSLEGKHPFSARAQEWERVGFLNYFGSQRFGTCGVSTAKIGQLILGARWEEAVRELLVSREEAHGKLGEALTHFSEHNDPAAALRLLSGGSDAGRMPTIETTLLTALKKEKNAYKSAILALPRDTRSLYVHAYQSLLFNRVLTKRVEEHGLDVLDGDVGVGGECLGTESGSIHDVYVPLPSAKSSTMEGEVSRWYRQFMEEDGVNPQAFSALERQFSIGDVLRPMMIKPTSVQWKLTGYNDARKQVQWSQFIPTDAKTMKMGTELAADSENPATEPGYHALMLQFDLPSGCYATVALRELLHWEMDKEAQKNAGASFVPRSAQDSNTVEN